MDLARSRAVSQSKQDVEPAPILRQSSAVEFALAAIATRFTVNICRLVLRRLSTFKWTVSLDLGATGVNAQRPAVVDIVFECENAMIQRLCECHQICIFTFIISHTRLNLSFTVMEVSNASAATLSTRFATSNLVQK